ncbi:NADPH-dependent methylglyoxal reductase gre2 protein [Colletotrichum truncatum]|uniref:NADPH-dependent methylglyoxal reductase gre2 protein n=1 Tax=Colletotrichum truncatum TaxID=5467 RepID=A0ACC3ZKW1_COLTU|nr:NADPH-dependent methylglyoxal reductase gre2 protein [Colletotrichum truncatum]KAF6786875.1 NADPH-dependent methylglyoxal reductase gre2 protein [Colletotrichum truncatum]
MTKVLVTGGTGFLGAHVVDILLQRGHTVVATVRSEEKGASIKEAFRDSPQQNLSTIVIPDIAAKGAFESLASHNLEAVIHVASPFHYNVTDPKKDLIDPAVLGTTGVLQAVKDSCPTVKRVIITASFVNMLDFSLAAKKAVKTYSEDDWSPLKIEDAYSNGLMAYCVSKIEAEKAAWAFVNDEKPAYTLTVINPPLIFGPPRLPVKNLSAVNTSNQLFAELILGKHKTGLPPTNSPVWVDVRDAALAHVKAMELYEAAAGKRFFCAGGLYSNFEKGKIVYDNFPELRDRIPEPANMGGMPDPSIQSYGINTSRAETVLGMEWTPLEKTIVDSVKTFIDLKE